MYNILIVDDSEDDVFLLLRELKKNGLDIKHTQVDTEETLITALESDDWDLVISDHNMPCYSSAEALAAVKAFNPDLPVIIVSGDIAENTAVNAMNAGAQDYVMKENLARLVPAIEREIRESESRHDKRKTEKDLEHLTIHDNLTGLANRDYFEKCIHTALNDSKANKTTHTLMSLDLDQFKIINDTSGHVAGDELLKQVSLVLIRQTSSNDTIARLGADEFGILVKNTNKEQAFSLAERIQEHIKDLQFAWQGKPFTTSISIGVVSINHQTQSVQGLMSCVDMACNTAKEKGHDGVQWFSEEDPEYQQRRNEMQWVGKIKQAIKDDHFVLHFQPMLGFQAHCNGEHGEFLVRLNDNDNLVFPGEFIPAAERYRLMPMLDRWVVKNAFKYLSESGLGKREEGTFFINLSGTSLSDKSFFNDIRALLKKYAIKPNRICLEITETAAIDNLSDAVEFISEIRDEGFKFALDDFGAGMSSFSYLKTIPVDYLKIDGSFVLNLLTDPIDRGIVEACNTIGHAAGLQTIAEFVEDQATADALKAIGVDFGQGFGIQRPGPLA
ncbi:MAG: diguanylate cyclase (GGDEF)-like protein [Oleiphilaceae bacterium]|jgi:diguanylate cyclase (GGDEF)-like protein